MDSSYDTKTGSVIQVEECVDQKLLTETVKLEVDWILDHVVKPCGLWQWSIALLLMTSAGSPMTFPVFGNSAAPYRCRLDEHVEQFIQSENISFELVTSRLQMWNNVSRSNESVEQLQMGCARPQRNWKEVDLRDFFYNPSPSEKGNAFIMEPCQQGYIYSMSDLYVYPVSMVREFELACELSWLIPMGTALYMCGSAVGNLLGGWSGGRFGRRRTLIVFTLFETTCGICTSLAPNYATYVLARCGTGLGFVARTTVAGVLVIELTLARYRSIFRAMISLGIAFIYRALMSLWAYLLPNWRWLNLAVTGPTVLGILYIFFLPESPRWLFGQKRYSDGLRVLQKAYKVNHRGTQMDKADDTFDRLFAEARQLEETETIRRENDGLKSSNCQCSLLAPLRNRKLARKTILSILIMIGMSMSYIGLLFYARVVRHYIYFVAFLNALISVPGLILFTLLYRFLSQRKRPLITLASLAMVTLSVGGGYTLLAKPSSDTVLIVCSNFAMFLLQAGLNMCVLYIPELFPSNIRTQGMGLILGGSKIGGIAASFVNYLDAHWFHGLPLIVYAGILFLVICTLFFLPDTTGEQLPDN